MVIAGDPLEKTHPEALLRRSDGTPVHWVCGRMLDPLHPFTREYLHRFFHFGNTMGVAGYKIDIVGPLAVMQNEHLAKGLIRPGEDFLKEKFKFPKGVGWCPEVKPAPVAGKNSRLSILVLAMQK